MKPYRNAFLKRNVHNLNYVKMCYIKIEDDTVSSASSLLRNNSQPSNEVLNFYNTF